MTCSGIQTALRARYIWAIAAGLLWAAAFPKIGMAGFAWIAPGLLLAAALGKDGWEAFRIGYVGALVFYLVTLYWLLRIPYRWLGIPLGPAAGWLTLSAFMALFPGLWVWLLSRTPRPDSPELVPGSSPRLRGWLAGSWAARSVWALLGATAWVALEMGIARIFGGFPWNLLGASQYQLVPLIQIASVTGIYGVSFLVVWVSLSLASATLNLLRRPQTRSAWLGEIFLPLLVTAVIFNAGARRVRATLESSDKIKVLLIQPSIPQTVIWDPSGDAERLAEVLRLTRVGLTNSADLVIWPESAIPRPIRYDEPTFEAVTSLAREHQAWFILGSDDVEPRPTPENPDEVEYFNSSFLISPQGALESRYNKRHLVIFGEYIPLARWMPFFKLFTPIQGGFTPGGEPIFYDLSTLGVEASVLICFEDMFPHLARTSVGPRTGLMVNLTNDGWFGQSAAQWQQAASAVFRAVENGVPLARCCNNGLTCWIDPRGRIREVFFDSRGTIYGPGFLRVEIPVRRAAHPEAATFYNQHGDVFGWTCLGIGGLLLAAKLSSARRPTPARGGN